MKGVFGGAMAGCVAAAWVGGYAWRGCGEAGFVQGMVASSVVLGTVRVWDLRDATRYNEARDCRSSEDMNQLMRHQRALVNNVDDVA